MGDEETFVLLLSDWQIGHKTRSFNARVALRRIDYLLETVIRILNLHRRSHPVKKINVFVLGDLVQNERIGYLVSLDELEMVARDQIFEVAVPGLEKVISTLLKNFEQVKVYCVRGNHGSLGRFAATRTNLDDVIYQVVKLRFRNEPRVHFQLTDDFYQIVNVCGWKFCLVHGDQVQMYLNFPWYGLTNKTLRWQQSLGKFDYLVCGHFHNSAEYDVNNIEIICNGTLVTDDDYVKHKLGWLTQAKQTLLSVHPKWGKVWSRKIKLP